MRSQIFHVDRNDVFCLPIDICSRAVLGLPHMNGSFAAGPKPFIRFDSNDNRSIPPRVYQQTRLPDQHRRADKGVSAIDGILKSETIEDGTYAHPADNFNHKLHPSMEWHNDAP